MSDFNPLVSIVVITYNSSQYVLETLESTKAQTYQNIELIVTDDGSTDSTVELCREWLAKNQARFVRTELITVPKNTGIPANCNRGIKSAKGVWLKIIAGDDALIKTCINKNVDFVKNNEEIQVCHSNIISYKNSLTEENIVSKSGMSRIFKDQKYSAADQFQLFSFKCIVKSPTVFIKKQLFEQVGLYDENIPFCEDWPMWLKITAHGIKFYFLDEFTVKYRLHGLSIYTGAQKEGLINKFYKIDKIIYDKYISCYVTITHRFFSEYYFTIKSLMFRLFVNKKNRYTSFIYNLMKYPYDCYYKYVLCKIMLSKNFDKK